MKVSKFFISLAIVVLLVGKSLPAEAEEFVVAAFSQGFEDEEQTLLTEINNERIRANKAPLIYSEKLQIGADIRSKEIAVAWSHTRPDGSEYWTADRKYIWGENLFKGTVGPTQVVALWMLSPSHKANILDDDFKTIAIGIYIPDSTRPNERYIAVEFGH